MDETSYSVITEYIIKHKRLIGIIRIKMIGNILIPNQTIRTMRCYTLRNKEKASIPKKIPNFLTNHIYKYSKKKSIQAKLGDNANIFIKQ